MENKYTSRRMSKEDRRKQILDAAMEVFTERGFSNSTTLEIAKAAGISEVTLFRHFSSKQEIFLEGIEPILFTTLEESINTSNNLNSEEKLKHILYERISFISKNHKIVKLILMETPLLSELGNENFIDRILGILKTVLNKIGIPMDKKEFTLRLLMGSILSFLYMHNKDDESIKSYVNKITDLILKEI